MVIWLERSADLHMAQLMQLPLTVSFFTKSTLVYPGSPGQRAVKRLCVCVCVLVTLEINTYYFSLYFLAQFSANMSSITETITKHNSHQQKIMDKA